MSAPARADDPFVDSRLTVTLGDDDLLHDAGESVPDSPRLGFGDRPGYELFYDNLNTRFSGRESLTHLVYYRKLPSFFDRVTTEAAVVMRLLFYHKGDVVRLEDTGSYIRVTYNPFDDPDDGLSLTAFPFNADRVRLGYLYRLSVGGDDYFPRKGWVSAPGLKLQLDLGPAFTWAAFKAVLAQTALTETANLQGTKQQTGENQYAGFLGLGADLLGDQLRLELAGAFIEQGDNVSPDVAGEAVWATGGAARLVLHHQMPIEDSLDFAIYRNDPNNPFIAFRPVEYFPGQTGYMISAETVALGQRLADPDVLGKTRVQAAMAWAIRARLQHDYLRLELNLLFRDLGFLVASNPGYLTSAGLPTWEAWSKNAALAPELMASLAADYHFPRQHLTLGLSSGLLFPAHVTTKLYASTAGSSAPPTLIGEHTMIVGPGGQTVLPEGEDPRPLVNSRLSLRLDLSEMLYTRLWLQHRYDPNSTVLIVNPDLTKSRKLQDAHGFGLGVSAALRL